MRIYSLRGSKIENARRIIVLKEDKRTGKGESRNYPG